MTQNTLSTTTYGLIGRPLGHSQSKAFFTRLFAEEGSKESYDNFELPALTPEALYSMVLMNPKLKGFNVTAPYKEEIKQYLDRMDENSTRVGAVNTVKIRRDSTGMVLGLDGYNTDVEGFRESVRPLVEATGARGAMILGTGGAAKAVAECLRQLDVPVLWVSRSKRGEGHITYDDITPEIVAANPLIVNATPLGTFPNTDLFPPFPYQYITSANACHDLVYNPAETMFMKMCRARGAKVKNGLEMLHGQAIASLKIWRQV